MMSVRWSRMRETPGVYVNQVHTKISRFPKNQDGSTLPLVALMLVGLLAMTGLVIDMGTLYVTKSHLQKTANAAVLSGAQELTSSDTAVTQVVQHILDDHNERPSLQSLSIELEHKVAIDLEKDVYLKFAQLLGIDRLPVKVHAAAQLGVMGQAEGAAPLGIDEAIPLEFGRTYKLKVDQTEVEQGNFGILALGGPGANTYEDNLRFGYKEELKIGDVIETQTGNIAGKTRSSIRERIENCPYEVGDIHHRDCSRILLVPVYRPFQHESGKQLKKVEITGFAYFYITEPMSPQDTAITGQFIKRSGRGFVDSGASANGAYTIRLTE